MECQHFRGRLDENHAAKIRAYQSTGIGRELCQKPWSSGITLQNNGWLWPSRSNIISANQMTQLVNHFAQNQANSTFQRSLAVLGRAGTLEELVPQTSPAIGRVFAKSGGLTGVLSYTGIVQTNKGKWLSFSLIINNHISNNANLRLYLDRFFETLIAL